MQYMYKLIRMDSGFYPALVWSVALWYHNLCSWNKSFFLAFTKAFRRADSDQRNSKGSLKTGQKVPIGNHVFTQLWVRTLIDKWMDGNTERLTFIFFTHHRLPKPIAILVTYSIFFRPMTIDHSFQDDWTCRIASFLFLLFEQAFFGNAEWQFSTV